MVRARTWWIPGRPLAVGGPSQKTKGSASARRACTRSKVLAARQPSRMSFSASSGAVEKVAGSGANRAGRGWSSGFMGQRFYQPAAPLSASSHGSPQKLSVRLTTVRSPRE